MSVRAAANPQTTETDTMGTLERWFTDFRKREKGSPSSRAKDQVIRVAVAVMPVEQASVSTIMTAVITEAPAYDCVLL
jgi:hypothetical protein